MKETNQKNRSIELVSFVGKGARGNFCSFLVVGPFTLVLGKVTVKSSFGIL
tara:strand:- start:9356 stop:9508 length:153 start_codon:yes stop_codon:yes gene_type:complete